jgi:hypothetical protein
LVAVTGFWEGPGRHLAHGGPNDLPTAETLAICDRLAVIWCIILMASVAIFRKRALWQLLGAPFVLIWPIGFAMGRLMAH